FVSDLYEWRAMHAGASGRAILAFLPEDERASVLARGLPALTSATITDANALERSLARTRGRGYALSVEERRAGGVGLAAPVLAAGGRVITAVGLALPTQRFDAADEPRLASLVTACARSITVALGG